MLPRAARLTRRKDFTLAVRAGRRAGRGTLVVHLARPDEPSAPVTAATSATPARVGFVVGRTVGGSVVRHQVTRRLRHLVRDRLDHLPPGAVVVVRALPAARDADSAALGRDLDAALRRLLGAPAGSGSGRPVPAIHGAGPGDPPTPPTPPTWPTGPDRPTPPAVRS